MATRQVDLLVDELRRAYAGEPWHGPSTLSVLADVGAEDAAARPIPGAHSIWELTLHLTSWVREVQRRLQAGVSAEPADGDWPAAPRQADRAAWEAARGSLAAAHEELVRVLLTFPDGRLHEAPRDPRPGAHGFSYAAILHGLAQHDAYHTGQISLLKKALATRGSR